MKRDLSNEALDKASLKIVLVKGKKRRWLLIGSEYKWMLSFRNTLWIMFWIASKDWTGLKLFVVFYYKIYNLGFIEFKSYQLF